MWLGKVQKFFFENSNRGGGHVPIIKKIRLFQLCQNPFNLWLKFAINFFETYPQGSLKKNQTTKLWILSSKKGMGSGAAKLFIEIMHEQNIYGQNMPSIYRPSSKGYVHLTRARVEFRFNLLEVQQALLIDDLIDF